MTSSWCTGAILELPMGFLSAHPPCLWGLQRCYLYFWGEWFYWPGFEWFSPRYSRGWSTPKWGVVVWVAFPVGHLQYDWTNVSDKVGKTSGPLRFLLLCWERGFLLAVLESPCLWQHAGVYSSNGNHLPPVTGRSRAICCSQHLDTALISF